VVTLYAFGEGGKEFRAKLGQACLDLDHALDLPHLEVVDVEDRMTERQRTTLQEFKDRSKGHDVGSAG
jgi:hypothetical protein